MKQQTYFTIDDLVNLINEPEFQEIIKYAEDLTYNDKAKAYKVTYEEREDVHKQSAGCASKSKK